MNTSTPLEDVEEAFIHRDIPIKNRKRNVKADGTPITLINFSLLHSSGRIELLKSRFAIQQENISKLIDGNFEKTLKEIKETSRRNKKSQKRNKCIQSKLRIYRK